MVTPLPASCAAWTCAFKAVRYGYPVYWAEYIVARDSEFQTLADLEGATWGYGDQGSTSGYMVPTVELAAAGITPGEQVQTGGHNQTVTAVYNGEVDFGTVFYSVPLNPEGKPIFTWDDYQAGNDHHPGAVRNSRRKPSRTALSMPKARRLLCDGYRILDARANIRTEAPTLCRKSASWLCPLPSRTTPCPSDRSSPLNCAPRSKTPWSPSPRPKPGVLSIGSADFYGWTGIAPATDAEYDMVRAMVEATGYTIGE